MWVDIFVSKLTFLYIFQDGRQCILHMCIFNIYILSELSDLSDVKLTMLLKALSGVSFFMLVYLYEL